MKLKDGVIWDNMHPKIQEAVRFVEDVYKNYNTEVVITSGKDGTHMANSLHYVGRAFDVRTFNILDNIIKDLKTSLGPNYDVILEKDHIHIEWDPKPVLHDS